MNEWIKKLKENKKLKEMIAYLFFGGLTTIVNFVVFFIARKIFNSQLVFANTLSWFLSVLFAFVTNKKWVFDSKTPTFSSYLNEMGKFFLFRALSYVIDMGCMLLLINGIHLGDFWAKLITQIIVVIANYVFSKFLIFTAKEE